MSVILPEHTEINPTVTRGHALAELNSGSILPSVIRAVREAQVLELKNKKNVRRGMSDAALMFFMGLIAPDLKAKADDLVFDIAITPEHRRMFPGLPERDGVSIWKEGDKIAYEFFNLEHRA